ncbi:hypothetical protein T492DRAFT_900158 [Pavlovales sp. CCMP2436]|nr:hypothetical protein T492DRAFT_900158 [Pavlovales sp. CCMP2436]
MPSMAMQLFRNDAITCLLPVPNNEWTRIFTRALGRNIISTVEMKTDHFGTSHYSSAASLRYHAVENRAGKLDNIGGGGAAHGGADDDSTEEWAESQSKSLDNLLKNFAGMGAETLILARARSLHTQTARAAAGARGAPWFQRTDRSANGPEDAPAHADGAYPAAGNCSNLVMDIAQRQDLEHDHVLLGVMHLDHNLFEQCFHGVWADIEALHPDTHNLVKHDLVSALRAMGCGLLDPGRKLQAHESTLPSFKGADLFIIRTDAGMMQILIKVYGLDEVPPPDEDTENLSSAANMSGGARAEAAARLRVAARAAANGGVRPEVTEQATAQRLSRCVNACKALDALWKVLRRYKDIGYDDSTEENRRRHAANFRADFAEFEVALRAFSTGEVASQHITEARKLAPLMIIKWDRLVAYVNEQVRAGPRVQERMVSLCKQLYHKSSDHATILRNYVRTTAAGVTYTVYKKTCATLQVLGQQIDYLRNLAAAATENRTAWNKQAHHGSKAWEVLELAEANSMQDELAAAQELARQLRETG